jgi:ketosteroid isomerase-like protein
MKTTEPVQVVLEFINRINRHDVDGICDLMTPDHLFVDGLGNKMTGAQAMRKGWDAYFTWFPDYAVSHDTILRDQDVVLLTGTASGTYASGGDLPKENHWQIPAAWKGVVRDGRIAEWHVYADNQPARKIMRGESL